MAYLLETNVFIQAKNLHYGFDFCPAFWDWLVQSNNSGKVISIRQVEDEMTIGDDELADWADNHQGLFQVLDAPTIESLRQVAQWVQDQQFEAAAVNSFLQDTDYYLIAYAKAHRHTVVTHEKPSDSLKKIKIPTVCIGVGVEFLTTFSMLRHERARFVLAN